MSIFEKINADIKDAMRNRDQIRLETLRMLKSKILAVNARGDVADADVQKLFKTYLGNLHEALEHANTAQRTEMIAKLQSEIAIVQEFLPKELSAEETRQLVAQAIAESGAKTKKDLGLVMKVIKQYNRPIDGKTAKDLATDMLE